MARSVAGIKAAGGATRTRSRDRRRSAGRRARSIAAKLKLRGEQQRDQAVPAVLGELADRRHVLEARVGHDRVEAAEAPERLRDGAPVRITEGVDGQKVTPAEAPAGTEQKRGRRRQQP